jgi:hypothetical protein
MPIVIIESVQINWLAGSFTGLAKSDLAQSANLVKEIGNLGRSREQHQEFFSCQEDLIAREL